jgi:hypothetical protein
MATERALFIPKKYRKWAEEVLKVQDPAELAKLYAESKAHRDEWRKSSGIAEWNRKHREERRPHHEAVAAPLELAIVEYINRRYAEWRRSREDLLQDPHYDLHDARRIFPEPSLSIGHIVDSVGSTLLQHDIDDRKEQYSVVNAALRRLVKKGLLKTSSGQSTLVKGRRSETRMYEPGEG